MLIDSKDLTSLLGGRFPPTLLGQRRCLFKGAAKTAAFRGLTGGDIHDSRKAFLRGISETQPRKTLRGNGGQECNDPSATWTLQRSYSRS